MRGRCAGRVPAKRWVFCFYHGLEVVPAESALLLQVRAYFLDRFVGKRLVKQGAKCAAAFDNARSQGGVGAVCCDQDVLFPAMG